jgi:hypothetical protein
MVSRNVCHALFPFRFVFLSVGRIVVKLFDDICPRTCDNFRSLCTGKEAFVDNQVTLINIFKEKKAGVQAQRRSCPTKDVDFIGSSKAFELNRAILLQVRPICHVRVVFFTSMKIFRFSFDLYLFPLTSMIDCQENLSVDVFSRSSKNERCQAKDNSQGHHRPSILSLF